MAGTALKDQAPRIEAVSLHNEIPFRYHASLARTLAEASLQGSLKPSALSTAVAIRRHREACKVRRPPCRSDS